MYPSVCKNYMTGEKLRQNKQKSRPTIQLKISPRKFKRWWDANVVQKSLYHSVSQSFKIIMRSEKMKISFQKMTVYSSVHPLCNLRNEENACTDLQEGTGNRCERIYHTDNVHCNHKDIAFGTNPFRNPPVHMNNIYCTKYQHYITILLNELKNRFYVLHNPLCF